MIEGGKGGGGTGRPGSRQEASPHRQTAAPVCGRHLRVSFPYRGFPPTAQSSRHSVGWTSGMQQPAISCTEASPSAMKSGPTKGMISIRPIFLPNTHMGSTACSGPGMRRNTACAVCGGDLQRWYDQVLLTMQMWGMGTPGPCGSKLFEIL